MYYVSYKHYTICDKQFNGNIRLYTLRKMLIITWKLSIEYLLISLMKTGPVGLMEEADTDRHHFVRQIADISRSTTRYLLSSRRDASLR